VCVSFAVVESLFVDVSVFFVVHKVPPFGNLRVRGATTHGMYDVINAYTRRQGPEPPSTRPSLCLMIVIALAIGYILHMRDISINGEERMILGDENTFKQGGQSPFGLRIQEEHIMSETIIDRSSSSEGLAPRAASSLLDTNIAKVSSSRTPSSSPTSTPTPTPSPTTTSTVTPSSTPPPLLPPSQQLSLPVAQQAAPMYVPTAQQLPANLQSSAINPSRKSAIIAHWKENIEWILPMAKSGWLVYVSDADDEKAQGTIQMSMNNVNNGGENIVSIRHKNWGREALPYLKFISENYNNLPQVMGFFPGDSFSSHAKTLTPYLQHVKSNWNGFMDNRQCDGYFPINDVYVVNRTAHSVESLNLNAFFDIAKKKWMELGVAGQDDAEPIPSYLDGFSGKRPITMYCCAGFILTRSIVHKHPHRLWKALYAATSDPDAINEMPNPSSGTRDMWTASAMEHSWHILFGCGEHTRKRTLDDLCGPNGIFETNSEPCNARETIAESTIYDETPNRPPPRPPTMSFLDDLYGAGGDRKMERGFRREDFAT